MRSMFVVDAVNPQASIAQVTTDARRREVCQPINDVFVSVIDDNFRKM